MTSIKKAGAALALCAVAALAQNLGFHFYGPVGRFVTPPNGASTGHPAVFCFDNPNGSGVSGQIFTLLGRNVATLGSPQPLPASQPACTQTGVLPNSMQFLLWNGESNGSFVHSGIYLYRIQAEGGNYTGSLVVVR